MLMHLRAALLLVVGASHAMGQMPVPNSANAPSYDGAILTARVTLERLMQEARLPGLSVAVGVDDRVVWSEGFGLADVETGAPVSPLTRFRVGSVSKPITSAAMLALVKAGRLDLDAPIRRYVPTFPEKRFPITARQLAGHLGGIRHYVGPEVLNRTRYTNVVDALERFAGDTLLHEPGTKYLYSSYGYNLLSAAIQGASGESFLTFVDRAVLQPLGMRHTVADHVDSIITGRASLYRRAGGRLLNARFTDDSYKWASGGFLSTTEDLVRFGLGLLDHTILGPAELELLFTPQRTKSGEGTGYGMGWRPDTDWEGRNVLHHGGSSEGGRSFLLMYPEQRVVVALLVNFNPAPVFDEEAQTIAHFFLDHPRDTLIIAAPPKLAGGYEFKTTVGRDSVTGILALTRSAIRPGWMSWDGSAPLQFVAIDTLHRAETRIIGAGSQGLVNLWLRLDEDTLGGRWNWLARTVDIRGKR